MVKLYAQCQNSVYLNVLIGESGSEQKEVNDSKVECKAIEVRKAGSADQKKINCRRILVSYKSCTQNHCGTIRDTASGISYAEPRFLNTFQRKELKVNTIT